MNIFRLDNDPIKAAEFHCDRHMKMILESGQMLSTCIREHGIDDPLLYRKFNPKHPCNVWLMESKENIKWLIQFGLALNRQNIKIFNKSHKSILVIERAKHYINLFPSKSETPQKMVMFPQFMGTDIVHSYKLFYAGAKYRFANWSLQTPYWWKSYREFVKSNNLEIENEKDDYILQTK